MSMAGPLLTMGNFTCQDVAELEIVNLSPSGILSIDTSIKKYGACSLKFASGTTTHTRSTRFLANVTPRDAAAGFYLYIQALPSSGRERFIGFDIGTSTTVSPHGGLALDSAGHLVITNAWDYTEAIWTSAVLSTATWYWVVLHQNHKQASTDYYRLKIYSVDASDPPIPSLVEDSKWQAHAGGGATNLTGFYVGSQFGFNNGMVVNIDSWMVTGWGTEPPIAPAFREWAHNAVGTDDTWTLGAGADKVVAVALPDDADTTYIVDSATVTVFQTYTHAATGIPGGSNVLAVGARVKGRGAGAGTITLRLRWRLGADAIQRAYDGSFGTSYIWTFRDFTRVDPALAAWTIANVDAVEMGVLNNQFINTQLARVTTAVGFVAYGNEHIAVPMPGEEADTNPLYLNRHAFSAE